MARNGEISLTDAKRVLRKYWWILPLSTLLLGALGFVATLVLPKMYTSTTNVLVEQPLVSARLCQTSGDRRSQHAIGFHESASAE